MSNLTKKFGDLSKLPPELREQLLSVRIAPEDQQLVDAVSALAADDDAGETNLDELLVYMYQQHGEILQRDNLSAKMYRITKKGLVEAVEGRRGVYRRVEGKVPDVTGLIPRAGKDGVDGVIRNSDDFRDPKMAADAPDDDAGTMLVDDSRGGGKLVAKSAAADPAEKYPNAPKAKEVAKRPAAEKKPARTVAGGTVKKSA